MSRRLPLDHGLRLELNDEVHARPPEAVVPPTFIVYLALLSHSSRKSDDWRYLSRLFETLGGSLPADPMNHLSTSVGTLRVTVERHSEFVRYMLSGATDPLDVPQVADWLTEVGGELLVATRVTFRRRDTMSDDDVEALSRVHFDGNTIIGAEIGGGRARAFTDFRVRADGFGRLLVLDDGLQPRQAGRMIQRLLEIDTYRMMALLTLPVARRLWPEIEQYERELSRLSTANSSSAQKQDAQILEQLMRLEADVEGRYAQHRYRFSASNAYYDLVQRRIEELREARIEGLQTFREFTERRLAPAISTCRKAADNIDALSQRIGRTTQLLSARVEVSREAQNRALLEGMARRARLQLRLQQTVEGLSIVAISYYVVGLVGYAAKALKGAGVNVQPDVLTGLSIPVVVVAIAFGLRRLHRVLGRDADTDGSSRF